MNEKALEEFIGSISKCTELVDKIKESLNNHLGFSPEDINWGHVGTVTSLEKSLSEICESLNLNR